MSERKAALRAQFRGRRGHDRSGAARAAVERVLRMPALQRAETIALYQAIGDEVPLEAVARRLRELAKRVLYPVVVGPELELAPDVARPERVPAAEVDLFLVPGQVFDRAGRRLGRGGGHYDRLLARKGSNAMVIGICYADRVVDELPEDPWDVRMDAVVTDQFHLLPGRAPS
ncbi:MAG TPA: 5-formyltetrahydrofolate cyclo-ligase [Myxococcota bacterium]|nr:5-formyltetrahydrofolate cyclo-ligase [Myxococcota bacterium]